MIYRVGIYLRLSNEDKVKKCDVSESIKNQRNMLIEYINKHPEFILIDEYCDEDLSGAGTFRPEFERLIKDCKKKRLDVVLCKSQSRFSRDMEIVEKYLDNLFLEWNIRFIGISDNADTKNVGNKKSRQINGLVNEWFLEDVSANIRSAFKSKMKQGEFISPFAPYGYMISKENNNKLVVDKESSIIVKEIFSLYLKGLGYAKIAKYLNDKNIPSPSLYKYLNGLKLNIVSKKNRYDIKWSSNAIKTILKNELYIGNLIQGKRTTLSYKNHKIINKPIDEWIRVKNTHEAIIEEETFIMVQQQMKQRTKVSKKDGVIHLFSGKVYCNYCHSLMKKKNSSKHEYLVCSNKVNCLNKESLRYDKLEEIILNKINDYIIKYFDITILNKELFKYNNNSLFKSLLKEKEFILKKKNNTTNYLKNLYEDKVNKIISNEQFKKLLNTYNIEENKLNKQLNLIDNKINYYENFKNNDNILKRYQRLNKLNRVVIEEFIDKIYIDYINKEERNIIIKWNF